MLDEDKIKKEMIRKIDGEIARLEQMKKEEDKLPIKARIIMCSCALLAKADGETSLDELFQMDRSIFKRFCINEVLTSEFLPVLMGHANLSEIKNYVEKYEIDKAFLREVYKELKAFKIEHNLSPGEEDILAKLFHIFNFPEENTCGDII